MKDTCEVVLTVSEWRAVLDAIGGEVRSLQFYQEQYKDEGLYKNMTQESRLRLTTSLKNQEISLKNIEDQIKDTVWG